MQTFAAIGLRRRNETRHEAVWAFMEAAHKRGLTFKALEVVGVFSMGSHEMVRVRTDLTQGLSGIAQDLQPRRAVVVPNGSGYRIHLPGGREGAIPTVTMLAAVMPNFQRTYRGPGQEHWERQFLDLQG